MSDIAHELKVRPALALHLKPGPDGPYVILSPQERDEAVAEIERLRAALRVARACMAAKNVGSDAAWDIIHAALGETAPSDKEKQPRTIP
jgi:hypothetical protein